MNVKTVYGEDSVKLDERVNSEIARIERNGGEVVNVSLAIHSSRLFCMYAMILFRGEDVEWWY